MPWDPSDAPKHDKDADTAKKKRKWAKIANSVLKDTGDESRAIRAASSQVESLAQRVRHISEVVPDKMSSSSLFGRVFGEDDGSDDDEEERRGRQRYSSATPAYKPWKAGKPQPRVFTAKPLKPLKPINTRRAARRALELGRRDAQSRRDGR